MTKKRLITSFILLSLLVATCLSISKTVIKAGSSNIDSKAQTTDGSTLSTGETKENNGRNNFPSFSWNTIPTYAHIAKSSDLFTDSEINFLANNFSLVCISAGHAWGTQGTTEKGFEIDCSRLKSVNPNQKVLFYWNSYISYKNYESMNKFDSNESWALHKPNGELYLKKNKWKLYDHTNIDCRKWWTSILSDAVSKRNADGFFIDAYPQTIQPANKKNLGEQKYESIKNSIPDLFKETRTAVGKEPIMIYNGLRAGAYGEILPYADGAYIEQFGHFATSKKEGIAADIESIVKYGKEGKIVIVKGWPGFDFLDDDITTTPYESLLSEAKKQIKFPLACYLVAAQKYSYFAYSWGYRENSGALSKYPELNMKLGNPLGDATRDGWVYTREFEHCSVRVDIENKKAEITTK